MYFFRKNGKYVYAVYRKDGELIPLPRTETAHLDGLPDDQVKAAVKRLEAIYKVREIRPDTEPCPAPFMDLIGQFGAYKASQGRHSDTIKQYDRYLRRLGTKYGWPLTGWPDLTKDFPEWSGREFTPAVAKRVRICLLAFWKWCLAVGHAQRPLYVLPVSDKPRPTPLKMTMTPDQVLALNVPDPELKLMILIGYFFSIRPQEMVALTKVDFAAGKTAAALECCKVMQEVGMYGRFAVRIEKQRRLATETPRDPKVHSFGWVACFDERAARAIVAMVSEWPADKLFEHGTRWYNERLKRLNLGFCWKDLRRASLYYLGHYSKMNKMQAKSHSRHKDDKSIEFYMRRPDADVARGLNLDD